MSNSTIHLEDKVRKILVRDWDPIGIADVPEAWDEYDIYIPHICSMLQGKKSNDDLYQYLRWIEVDRMGINGRDLHTRFIANRLVNLLDY